MASGNHGSVGPVLFESVSQVTATNSVELGTKVTVDGCDYVYVYNAGGEEIDRYHGCILSAVSGYSVTVSSVSAQDALFGVAHHVTIPTANYGWVMVRGFANVVNARASSALTAGADLYLASDGKFDSRDVIGTITAGTFVGPSCGKLLFAPSSGGTGTSFALAYVKGLG